MLSQIGSVCPRIWKSFKTNFMSRLVFTFRLSVNILHLTHFNFYWNCEHARYDKITRRSKIILYMRPRRLQSVLVSTITQNGKVKKKSQINEN